VEVGEGPTSDPPGEISQTTKKFLSDLLKEGGEIR